MPTKVAMHFQIVTLRGSKYKKHHQEEHIVSLAPTQTSTKMAMQVILDVQVSIRTKLLSITINVHSVNAYI